MSNIFDKLVDLPVFDLLEPINAHTATGGIAIVHSETGSGKSLLVPLSVHYALKEAHRVYVIQPRRFLAINAAESLSELSETELGVDFGYLIGHTGSGEENRYSPERTRVAFTTYGFALATKLIMQEDYIVLDEIHEQSLDMDICKALLKYRYTSGNPPKQLILMSASLNAEAELAYWNDVAPTKAFSASTGRKFACEKIHLPATPIHAAVTSLLDEGRKGILVFAPGVGEIKDILEEFNKSIPKEAYPNLIIYSIHGQSDYAERKNALEAPPEGYSKVLVGTNVIESGMNLPWVDAGVTTGDKKELHVRAGSGAVVLTKVHLAKTNVDQQAGRTNRFCDSKFIICGPNSYSQMSNTSTAEIERLPLTSLYMHCESIDINPNDLRFMKQPSHEKMQEAAYKLQNLGFFDKKLKFTEDGKFANDLPVGLETAALLCHARKLNILADAIVLAAVYEVQSLRKDHARSHGFNSTSDYLDGAMAYAEAVEIYKNVSYADRPERMENWNIGMRRFNEASLIVKSLEQRFGVRARLDCYQLNNSGIFSSEDNKEKIDSLRQCLLAASVCNIGIQKSGFRGKDVYVRASGFVEYQMSNGTAVHQVYDIIPVAAKLRVITPRNNMPPFTVAEHITQFSMKDIESFNRVRPGVFTKEVRDDGEHFYVNGVKYHFEKSRRQNTGFYRDDSGNNLGDILTDALRRKAAGGNRR